MKSLNLKILLLMMVNGLSITTYSMLYKAMDPVVNRNIRDTIQPFTRQDSSFMDFDKLQVQGAALYRGINRKDSLNKQLFDAAERG